jgi:hypothetical protein
MRTDANQCELPFDVDEGTFLRCKTEAEAVQICLRIALARYGRDQQTVSALCGWKSDSCLSEAASESSKRCIPKARRARFTLATGCTLLEKFLEREAAKHDEDGKATKRERLDRAVAATMARYGQQPRLVAREAA